MITLPYAALSAVPRGTGCGSCVGGDHAVGLSPEGTLCRAGGGRGITATVAVAVGAAAAAPVTPGLACCWAGPSGRARGGTGGAAVAAGVGTGPEWLWKRTDALRAPQGDEAAAAL
jgi:hypothetical protein